MQRIIDVQLYMASSTSATQTKHRFRPTSLFQSGWLQTDSSSIDPSLSFYGAPPSGAAVQFDYSTFALDDTEVREADTTAALESTLTAA